VQADTGLGQAVDVLADGTSFVGGYFYDDTTFGLGETNETTLSTTNTGPESFIAKYNPDGTLAWAAQTNGTGFNTTWGVTAFADGSCFAAGRFEQAAVWGQGEVNETMLVSAGGQEIFVSRYGSGGNPLWARRAGGNLDDLGLGIDTTPDGSALVTGVVRGTAVFGPGETNQTTIDAYGELDMFVAEYMP
jgi:hypothetical protein